MAYFARSFHDKPGNAAQYCLDTFIKHIFSIDCASVLYWVYKYIVGH